MLTGHFATARKPLKVSLTIGLLKNCDFVGIDSEKNDILNFIVIQNNLKRLDICIKTDQE